MHLVIRDKNGEIGRISEENGTIVGDTEFAVKLAKSYADDVDFVPVEFFAFYSRKVDQFIGYDLFDDDGVQIIIDTEGKKYTLNPDTGQFEERTKPRMKIIYYNMEGAAVWIISVNGDQLVGDDEKSQEFLDEYMLNFDNEKEGFQHIIEVARESRQSYITPVLVEGP
jgi:hypothetical protein